MSSKLNVNELFVSIQGEGFWTGTPATFLRLQGCNLRCPWCDSQSTWNRDWGTEWSIADTLAHITCFVPRTVVVTGGEPLLQQQALNKLIKLDKSRGHHHKWHLETNGTFRINGDLWDWVTVSPKPPDHKIKRSVKVYASEVKFVITHRDDIAIAQRVMEDVLLVGTDVCLQPVDNDPAMTEQCIQFLIHQPEEVRRRWRLSMQVHKFIGVK